MTPKIQNLCLFSWLAAVACVGANSPNDSSSSPQDLLLADFEGSEVAATWKTVNDNVMGGRSKGGPSFENGMLVFSGETNTNGGGFSSIRTEAGQYDLSGKSGLLMRVKGDGRTYKASLRTDAKMRSWAVPFRADFETVQGDWQEIYLPFESFTPTFHGRTLSDPPSLDTSRVNSFGFMIYDKMDGPFSLEVDWVKAVCRTESGQESEEQGTIVARVLADGRFSNLAAALSKAGLVDVLKGDGPFTVFAPTDDAFGKLPEGMVKDLLDPDNVEKLQQILKYHVSAGETRLGAALAAGSASTVQGELVSVKFSDGRVKVNDASILDADINCSNGVIHVIDALLIPPAPANDILSVATGAGSFSTLLAAVEAAGLTELLSGEGPLTILAPTDDAFEKLPDGTVEELLKEENRGQLKAILAYHAIKGRVSAGDALNVKSATTLNGKSVEFGIENGRLVVNGATIRQTDIECDNGVIHVIDAVLLPPSADSGRQEESPAETAMSPVERIEAAIERGVPIFNGGDAAKCAAIYEECLTELAQRESINPKLRAAVKALLKRGDRVESDVDRAWLFRSGLDHLYAAISNS